MKIMRYTGLTVRNQCVPDDACDGWRARSELLLCSSNHEQSFHYQTTAYCVWLMNTWTQRQVRWMGSCTYTYTQPLWSSSHCYRTAHSREPASPPYGPPHHATVCLPAIHGAPFCTCNKRSRRICLSHIPPASGSTWSLLL